ncbi:sodium/hydrogen exchanger family protein [Colletotrichum higginsianum]|uniref:Sodium/hydrogen exchanger family protein n=2 Tax=Colletotrichum higginsianum TaxID=80884 RepID=H1VQV1_COLHI|nr:Sodium/hydrogen exchanger family protein [Colletotrichum higginsianum IMI 349063]OBR06596.1 Sodium/hydrogen exchanger family protein [Colletotrichum higginsianum IMI 349063]TIC97524.1 Na(+)/H(+)-K(+) antiporter GerN [Colletotrichum higginsianum]CCF42607.1 sodium/hydrogen exchanger family protein [Colletotrichum higginsianum]
MATFESSLAYHEPSITTIIILSGFLLLLNGVNFALDKLVYCGLIGQVFLGIAWGTPGAKWLPQEMEQSIMQLGYLGLILIVFEGGLSTSFRSLKANLLLSIGVAMTGIAVPMGLSFTLSSMVGASPLQAFAAGAALCSTSLGTTFTVLGTSGLTTTRMGVVLTSAAMMDDVIGLIMVQIVSNLGGGGGSGDFNAVTVVRPVLVSLGFATLVPAACKFIVGPVTLRLNAMREKSPGSKLDEILRLRQTALVLHTCWLFGLVVGGTFAGTSSLLAAYVAGATISWWDSEVPHLAARTRNMTGASAVGSSSTTPDQKIVRTGSSTEAGAAVASAAATATAPDVREPDTYNSGVNIYEHYYSKAVEHVLKPFFFASIGFSVPITRMFSGPIVWRGVVYTILMMVSKMLCGLWLLSFASPLQTVQRVAAKISGASKKQSKKLAPGTQCAGTGTDASPNSGETMPQRDQQQPQQEGQASEVPLQPSNPLQAATTPKNASPEPEMPVSVYPACILGFAMVARGEIGYLISALAESTGIFSGGTGAPDQPSELFLMVTWAITLCTIIGPICVGLLVNRVKRLEMQSGKGTKGGGRNVLGAWGLN